MWGTIRFMLLVMTLAFVISLLLPTAAAFAEDTKAAPSAASTNAPADKPSTTADVAKAPPANPQDVRALSPDEVKTYQATSDSLAQNNGQLQEMNVGAGVNGTVVLSVLVALVIFAVLVAIL